MINAVFDHISSTVSKIEYTIKSQMVEIYN